MSPKSKCPDLSQLSATDKDDLIIALFARMNALEAQSGVNRDNLHKPLPSVGLAKTTSSPMRITIASIPDEQNHDASDLTDRLPDPSDGMGTQWQHLREAVANVSQGIGMFDPDFRLVVWNQRFLELLNLPVRFAVVGTPFEELLRFFAQRGEYGPGDPEAHVQPIIELTRLAQPYTVERSLMNGNMVEIIHKPLLGGGFICTYTDITERKRQEQALREENDILEQRVNIRTAELLSQQEKLRQTLIEIELILDNASLGIATVIPLPDGARIMRRVNRALGEMFGYASAELEGKDTRILYPNEATYELLAQAYHSVMSAGETYRGEHSLLTKNGQDIVVAMVGTVIDPNDMQKGTIWLLDDISDRKQAEQAIKTANLELNRTLVILRDTQKELIESEKLAALGSLVAGVAHELNTPLGNSILAASSIQQRTAVFSEAISSGIKRSTLNGYLDDIVQATDVICRNLHRAAQLVSSFKLVAVDQSSASRCCFLLQDVVGEILAMSDTLFKSTPYIIRAEIADNIQMDSFPALLGQVLVNLINNAVIHGFDQRQHGTVSIHAHLPEEQWVELKVIDDGVGILPANIGRVFEPFYTTKLGHGGSGLGLNVSHSIITGVLGGKISVASEMGTGTTFTLRLPASAPNAIAAAKC